MGTQRSGLRELAAGLARGPVFLLLGQVGAESAGLDSINFRWSGVYTSATTDIADRFRTEWRSCTSMGAMSTPPSRSQSELQVRHLFGGVHLPDGEQPAHDLLGEADVRMRAIQELSRLMRETITPRGVIIIDRWLPGDILRPEDLIPALRQLGAEQAHLFSSAAWRDDPFVQNLADLGHITLHEETLDHSISTLIAQGAVTLGPKQAGGADHHVIAIGDGFAEIDIHTWNQVRKSARPVDLDLLIPPNFGSEAARYQEFRNFIGATEGIPRWPGIAAGMNIRRDFEGHLARRVSAALMENELPPPIIVRGQTATGKSVALAALAGDLARTGQVAVLHQSRRTVRPTLEDLDMFAAWADDHGAEATVLVWDGMAQNEDYAALWRQLRARGRKLLIVGSAYLLRGSKMRPIDASVELSREESDKLRKLLRSFEIQVPQPTGVLDSSFLAFLYHALPETHFLLRRGLASELRAAELGMDKLVRERGVTISEGDRLTAMASALQSAGFAIRSKTFSNTDSESTEATKFGQKNPTQKVTTLILVAGSHGVPVPIDLALRILGREASQNIRDALNTFDIIRETDDDNGEFFLTVRSHLEAEILAKHEISVELEIEVIVEAIHNIRVIDGFTNSGDEVQFLVSLLDRIGPNAHASRYRPFYGTISAALEWRREDAGIMHPRLVLQESNFARNYVHWRQNVKDGTTADRISSLAVNRNLLEEALSVGSLSRMMRLSLTVELASTLGAIIHENANGGATPIEIIGQLDDILEAVLTARQIDPGNLHPVDVLAWSTRDAIVTNALAPHETLNRLANAVATIDSIDRAALTDRQQAQLDRRGVELNRILSDDDAVWARLQMLEANSDPAATYFLAKFEAEAGQAGESAALDRLRGAPSQTRRDWRCAQLVIELTWKSLSGKRLFSEDRVPVYFSDAKRQVLVDLITELDDIDLPDQYKLLFLKGILQFTSGLYADSKNSFREVERLTQQLSKRMHTMMLLANATGQPQAYTGRVEWADSRKGEVWVAELGTKIAFEPHLFSPSKVFTKNEQLPAFYIGFKMTRGVVAEPRNMYRRNRPQ